MPAVFFIGIEEVFKMKNMLNENECVNVKNRRVSLAQYVLLMLMGIVLLWYML